MKYISFELTMPGVASWNGRWSGEGRLYAIVKSVSNKYFETNKDKLIGHWHYRWDDGWAAMVKGREIDAKEKKRIEKETKGFYGYNWMVDSIMLVGEICNDKELKELLKMEKKG